MENERNDPMVLSARMAEALNVYQIVLEATQKVFGGYMSEKVMKSAIRAAWSMAEASLEEKQC